MKKKVMEQIQKIFPDLTDSNHKNIYLIYLNHLSLIKRKQELSEEKRKSIMDTITYSVKNTINLSEI
jgi:hypothetical protein